MMKTKNSTASLLLCTLAVLTAAGVAADVKQAPAERDPAAEEAKTPLDQSNRPDDLKITQNIRKAVIADDSLSLSAKNVRIITAEGKVTLRGSVNSVEEKQKVIAHAKTSAGSAEVVNQIEVKDARP